MACSAKRDRVSRSAHSPPHQARSSGVEKHQALADVSTREKPASRAQERRWRPAVRLATGTARNGAVQRLPLDEALRRRTEKTRAIKFVQE